LAELMPAALSQGQDSDELVRQVWLHLDEVKAIDASIAASKLAWQSSAEKAGPELAAALADVADLIKRLATHVSGCTEQALAQQRRLEPQLDGLVRGQQMQRAYGSAR